jgi:hypothetical protein
MSILPLLLLTVLSADTEHGQLNPVYHELRENGLSIGPNEPLRLPAPAMADGLTAQQQQAVIERIGGRRYSAEQLLRPSVVAPFVMQMRDVHYPDADLRARVLSVHFVAHADLDTLAESGELAGPGENGDDEWQFLTEESLRKRGIELEDDAREAYLHAVRNVQNRVQVSVTIHTFWSRTDDSILLANRLDPRFVEDREFPNQWRPLTRDPAGRLQAGAPQPYDGVGGYTKITRLAEPQGALFIESHMIFAEPDGWFDGTNLLGSKMPAIVQHEVRSARRDLLRMMQTKN